MITILRYYNAVSTRDGLTASIDNVVLDVYISRPEARDRFMKLLSEIELRYSVTVVHWQSNKIGHYKDQFSVRIGQVSFWLGVALNSYRVLWGKIRAEFNPNKLGGEPAFNTLIGFLVANSQPFNRSIRRFDLALDIKTDRANVFMVKDGRVYSSRKHGREYTEYMGRRSVPGRVKLYNKQQESGLDYPLTRLELTLDPENPYEEQPWPVVYYYADGQIPLSEWTDKKVTDTDRFILNSLIHGVGTLNDLGRRVRAKMELLMKSYVKRIVITEQEYGAILLQLNSFLNGTAVEQCLKSDKPSHRDLDVPDWVRDAAKAPRAIIDN